MGWLKYLEILLFILFLGCAVGLPIWYCKSFYAQRAKRQKGAEEHLLRHGGERVLEWNGEAPPGEADAEYGTLLVEVAAKRGGENARFYEKGLVTGKRRMPYSDIRDVVYAAGTPGKSTRQKRRSGTRPCCGSIRKRAWPSASASSIMRSTTR